MVGNEGDPARSARVQAVVEECVRRRVAGESVTDDQVLAEHPDLAPELAAALRRLALIEQAERTAHGSSGNAVLDDDRPPSLRSFPGYRTIGEIHRGGQGIVYQAVQRFTQRDVAIKVVRYTGADANDRAARFQREVEILGRLNHRNILTIHESGLTADAFYYVTDYVSGDPLDAYMATRQPPIRERLTLCIKICDAVNAAHRLGVIHRDLKPGNILIGQDGEPHVLDFGLAKVIGNEFDERAMTTTGAFVGSLPWAAPEQLAGMPHEIDVRTDVYALGVLLYQTLTGQFPYSVTGNVRDVIDNVLTSEPVRPSRVRADIDEDVETILLKCLAKERERRYQTAGELARDLRHYLANEPLDARQASRGYLLRKQLRRHRWPIVLGAAFVLTIAAGLIVSLVFWRAAVRERDESERLRIAEAEQRAQAEDNAAQAEAEVANTRAVLDFLNNDLLAAADPMYSADRDLTVKQAVDAASARLEDRFEEQPLVAASIDLTLGVTYKRLGEYASAERHLLRALEVRRAELGDEDAQTLDGAYEVGHLYYLQGRYKEAEAILAASMDTSQRVLGLENRDTLRSMNVLGRLYRKVGRYEEAEVLAVEVLDVGRRMLGEEHQDTLAYLNNLGELRREQGRFEEAEQLLEQVYTVSRRVLGDEHLHTLTYLNNLGLLYGYRSRFDEAEPLLVRSLELRRRVLGGDHPNTVRAVANLGALYRARGQLSEAEPFFVQALEDRTRLLGEEHLETIGTMRNLALLYREQRRLDEAEPLYQRALELSTQVLGEEHPLTIRAMTGLGLLYRDSSRLDEAAALSARALEIHRRTRGPDHPTTLNAMHSLATVYLKQGQLDDAQQVLVDALATGRRVLKPNHVQALSMEHTLALVRFKQGDYVESERRFRKAYEGRLETLGMYNRFTIASMQGLVRSLARLERFEEAEQLLLACYDLVPGILDPERDEGDAVARLAVEMYEAWNRPDRAAEWEVRLDSPPPGSGTSAP
jgi:tetratricopeptide (TPR) repeat protein/tRNA A-37 threonylcarbamoyl transferase component Bud32